MEFGPSCASSSDYGFFVAILLVACGAHALLSLLFCFDWSEMARGQEAPNGAAPRHRASLVAVVALAFAAYQILVRLWDLNVLFPNAPVADGLLGLVSPPEWFVAMFALAAVLMTVFAFDAIRPAWPTNSPYGSAAEAATRPLRLPV